MEAHKSNPKRATKLIPELYNKPYRDRLVALTLPTLKYRRYRGDMIELFKIVKGIYDNACTPHFDFVELSQDLIRTRGNKYKLVQHHCHYDLRKFNFTNRVVCLIMSYLLTLSILSRIVWINFG